METLLLNIELAKRQNLFRSVEMAGGEVACPRPRAVCSRKFVASCDEKRNGLDANLNRFERVAKEESWPDTE